MINAFLQKDGIYASYRNNGALDVRRLGDAKYVGYARDPKHLPNATPDFDGWFKGVWADYDSRKAALIANPTLLFEADVTPVRRFMTDHACVLDPPLRCFLDIETDSRGTIDDIINGYRRVLAIVVVGEDGRVFKETLAADFNDAEKELIDACYAFIQQYDQVCAWNGDRFDFTVLKERAIKVKSQYAWDRRLLMVDQLAAYKRFNTASESGDEKTSMALQNVAMALLGEGKNDFNARKTWEAWEAGGAVRQEMLDYCEQDTVLLQKIEKKTGYLDLFQTLCQLTTALPNSHGLKPTAQVDAMLLRKAHLAKTHLPSKMDHSDATGYPGAFVMAPIAKGIERTVHVADFASLYPSIIRTWNMGHETKDEIGCISPGTGITFACETESMLAATVRESMSLRTEWKKRKEALPPGTEEWKDADRKSTAYKVFANSIYGVIGSPYSRFYDREIVESVTLNGQWLIKQTIAAADARGFRTIYGDTDSIFVTGPTVEEFASFVKWCNSDLYPRILNEHGCAPEFVGIKLAYEKAFDRLVFPTGNDGEPVAKRYAGAYLHYGGTAATKDSKPEIKGLEYKRGDSIRYARRMQETCITMLLAGHDDPLHLEAWVSTERSRFFEGQIALEDIVMTKSISQQLADYKVNAPHVRVARELELAGEDVSQGTRIAYVITDGRKSPAVVISATNFNGEFDRFEYWNTAIYPPTLRLLSGAFPGHNWNRWIAKRPKPVLPGQLQIGFIT